LPTILPDLPPPTLRLRLDEEALAHNWRALDRLSGEASAGAAVKADAYGLGVDNVVPVLRAAGVRDFFVAHWSEVPAVLRHLEPASVAVLHGPLRAEDAQFARTTGVRPVINSLRQARLWTEAGGGPCDLMVDTGINRLGLPLAEIGEPLVAALEIDTLMSHLASADEDTGQNARQLALFEDLAREVPARRRSLANSAGVALGSAYAFELTRPGLSLYGGVPRAELAGAIRQVAHPQAAVLQLRDLAPGDSVGYNATFTADRPLRAATVSLGYADGFLRCWSGRAALRSGEAVLPLLGRVSMDMVVVDCTAAPDLREGDWLDVPYSLPEAAARCDLSQYELLTLLGRRFRRASLT
jgi:alanine racemase